MNKRMLELYQQAHVDYTAIDPSNNMPYKSACFSADRFAELIIQECMQVSMDSVGLDAEYEAWYLIGQHFGVNNEVTRTHHRISPKT